MYYSIEDQIENKTIYTGLNSTTLQDACKSWLGYEFIHMQEAFNGRYKNAEQCYNSIGYIGVLDIMSSHGYGIKKHKRKIAGKSPFIY